MEGRQMLSGVAAPPSTVAPPSGQIVVADANQAKVWNQVAAKAPAGTTGTAAVVQGGTDVASDAWNGYWLVHSKNVATLGYKFAKQALAHDTRKVGGDFLSAVLQGNGKRINQLSHTNAAKKVAADFSRLSSSPGVKYVGDQFAQLGRSIAGQFNSLFGTK